MLHPVLPPAPPFIVESLQPANPISTASDTKFLSVAEIEAKTQEKKNQPKTLWIANSDKTKNSPRQPTPQEATRHDLAVAKTQAAPDKQQSFPPEFSPITTANTAAALGQPQAIGYPMQQVEAFNLGDSNSPNANAASAVTQNKNLSQIKGQILKERLARQERQSNTIAQNAPPAQPTQSITYTNPEAASTQPVQNVIEFKSRSQTSQITLPQPITPERSAPIPPANSTNQQQSQPGTTPPASTPPARERIVEVTSDRQEYDQQRRIVTAEGNVVVRFDGAVVDADRLQVNLDNLIAVGNGNVALTRGDQVLRGERFTYNFIQDSGELENGRGDVNIPTAGTDFAFTDTDVTGGGVPQRPPSDRIRANQPLTNVGSPGGINLNLGGRADARNIADPKQGGVVKRVRFQAERVDFYPRGWQARNVRFTNDPFSPPELELRADKVTLTRESPLVDRIKTERQRLVLDQRTTLPIPIDRQTIDRRQRDVTPAIASIGYDGTQRGGLFIERSFQPFNTDTARFSITPQFFAQKAVSGNADNLAALFGLKARLNATLSPKTVVEGSGVLTSLDLGTVEDNLRASLRLRQELGDRNPHILNLEYSYRDRLYNGTLGFQTVQSSLGAVVTSPVIPLGKSGLNLRYQGGAQYINANSDRQDLLETRRENDRISLGRVQGSATVDGGITLWQGKPLPPTATEGLRYTPNSVVPYVQAFGGVTGTTSYYSSGDNQSTLIGTIGLRGQFGHFSRPAFDYTAFNVSYSQGIFSGASPFLFDRAVDNRVLNAGISQQIYGPFSLGFQTSINLDTGERSSTDYILEYSRRTYGITLRYNPVLELGGISFRISDFNWSGGTDPFSDTSEVKPVRGGVRQDY